MCEMMRWTVHLKGEPKRDQPKRDHAAVAVGHKVYSFGGYGQNMVQIEVHIFNTVSLCWFAPVTIAKGERPAEVPSRRYYHTAVLIGDTIYIWGGVGATESTDNVLYAFDVNAHKWFIPKVSGAIPDAKWGHSACVLGKVIYIYGGYKCSILACSNDIYKLDTTTMLWSLIIIKGPPAPAAARHSATIIGTKMFVFGGGGQYNKIYIRVFDTVTNRWLSTTPTQVLPEGRRRHSAFSYNGELYIFGGHNLQLDYTFNDMWKFNPETFSWKRIDPKGVSFWSYGMCCCMVGDRVIFFGGFTPNDLYILDLSPSLNTLCKLVVIEYKLDQSLLPQDIKWELETMTSNSKCKTNRPTHLSVLAASQPT